MVRIISVSHALRLSHTKLLRKMPVQKGIIHIKLVNFPLAIKNRTKHSIDGDEIYHVTKGLMKVNTWLLVKAFNNKANFAPCNRAIRISFDAKHPPIAQ